MSKLKNLLANKVLIAQGATGATRKKFRRYRRVHAAVGRAAERRVSLAHAEALREEEARRGYIAPGISSGIDVPPHVEAEGKKPARKRTKKTDSEVAQSALNAEAAQPRSEASAKLDKLAKAPRVARKKFTGAMLSSDEVTK